MAEIEPTFSPPKFKNREVSEIPPPLLVEEALKTERILFMIGGFLYHTHFDAHLFRSAKRQVDEIIFNSVGVIVNNVAELEYANAVAPPRIPFFVISGDVNPIEHGRMVSFADDLVNGRVVHFPDILAPSPPRSPPQNHYNEDE